MLEALAAASVLASVIALVPRSTQTLLQPATRPLIWLRPVALLQRPRMRAAASALGALMLEALVEGLTHRSMPLRPQPAVGTGALLQLAAARLVVLRCRRRQWRL